MAKPSRGTFHKREKERARQHKQHDKAQRRLAAKARRADSAPHSEGDDLTQAGMRPEPHAVPAQWDDATPTA
jgi:hypothetical protein